MDYRGPTPSLRASGVRILGPILFTLCTTDVVTVIELRGLSAHQYADDTHVYGRCHPNDATSLCRELGGCIKQVACWMSANCLQLNAAKTEFLWLVPPRRRHQLPPDHLVVGPVQVAPVAPQLATWVSTSTVT